MEYKKLGLKNDVFSDDARKYDDELVTNYKETEDLLYGIESESMVLIEGPNKSGKTRLALNVINKYRGEGKIIYIDMTTYNKEIDISHLLIYSQPFFRKLFNKMPEDMILIVDNAYTMKDNFYNKLQYFFDQSYLQSVVFIKKTNEELELPQSIQNRIGTKIKLKNLRKKDCISIASNRLNGLMNKTQIEQVWNTSPNLTSLLQNCKKIIDKYIEEDRKEIDNKFIEKVLKK